MSDSKAFDKEGALERVDDDLELFFELVDMFFSEYEQQLVTLRGAVDSGTAKELEETAHSIKSALGNIGAMRAFDQAFILEKKGREESLEGASDELSKLESYVSEYKTEVEAFRPSE